MKKWPRKSPKAVTPDRRQRIGNVSTTVSSVTILTIRSVPETTPLYRISARRRMTDAAGVTNFNPNYPTFQTKINPAFSVIWSVPVMIPRLQKKPPLSVFTATVPTAVIIVCRYTLIR